MAREAFLAELVAGADRLLAVAGICLKPAVSRERRASAHDPEMRHRRKNSRQRFDGLKAAVAMDPRLGRPRQRITAVAVLPGKAPDAYSSLELGPRVSSTPGCR